MGPGCAALAQREKAPVAAMAALAPATAIDRKPAASSVDCTRGPGTPGPVPAGSGFSPGCSAQACAGRCRRHWWGADCPITTLAQLG